MCSIHSSRGNIYLVPVLICNSLPIYASETKIQHGSTISKRNSIIALMIHCTVLLASVWVVGAIPKNKKKTNTAIFKSTPI